MVARPLNSIKTLICHRVWNKQVSQQTDSLGRWEGIAGNPPYDVSWSRNMLMLWVSLAFSMHPTQAEKENLILEGTKMSRRVLNVEERMKDACLWRVGRAKSIKDLFLQLRLLEMQKYDSDPSINIHYLRPGSAIHNAEVTCQVCICTDNHISIHIQCLIFVATPAQILANPLGPYDPLRSLIKYLSNPPRFSKLPPRLWRPTCARPKPPTKTQSAKMNSCRHNWYAKRRRPTKLKHKLQSWRLRTVPGWKCLEWVEEFWAQTHVVLLLCALKTSCGNYRFSCGVVML